MFFDCSMIQCNVIFDYDRLHAKFRRLADSTKPAFGTLNRGYLRSEMEMGDYGGAMDDLSARYDQRTQNL